MREVTLDAAELAIEQVTMAGRKAPLTYWSEGDKLRIRLDRDYKHGEQFAVTVRYSAHPRTGLVFVHPMEGNPDLPTQAWTQGQTEYHHYWFPCHDFPNDRATTALQSDRAGQRTSRSPMASSKASPRMPTARRPMPGSRTSRTRRI